MSKRKTLSTSDEKSDRVHFNLDERIDNTVDIDDELSIDVLGLREVLSTLPIEQTVDLNVEKLSQKLTDAFYTYESTQAHYVFDRDMANVIYSLGLVPSLHDINQMIFAMRYHPHARTVEREEIDAEHHLIHFIDYADIIIPRLFKSEYQPASETDLLKCLEKLDQSKKHYLHKRFFIQTLSTMEDALDQNETEELMSFLAKSQAFAIEHLPDFFNYKKYAKHLLPQRHRIYLELTEKE